MSLATNVANLATRIATEMKALRTLINGNATDLTALSTTAKTNLVAAINEVNAKPTGSTTTIDDATTSDTKVWSSTKTKSYTDTAVTNLVASSPAALDTLNELAAALGNDANFATTTSTALGNRVRVDAEQAFTSGQKAQGRVNLDAVSSLDVGDTEANFVTTFNDGLL